MPFEDYQKKRNFDSTSEPKAESVSTGESSLGEAIPIKSKDMLEFVVHKHFASHLHFDLRLELDGVLKSWAVPKGPSINPKDKKLAVMVEDHPLEYKDFEGIIPEGNYGAGKVYIWDYGTYHALDTDDMQQSSRILREGLEKGHMTFILNGEKLRGEFALIRLKKASPKDWLLIKKNDEFAAEIDISVLEAPGEAAVL
jgi:bifunctional non-homologous end joining protein LigD